MEGNENPNTARRERAVRPVRRTSSSNRSGEEGTERRSSSGSGRRPSGSSRAEGGNVRRRPASSGGTEGSSARRRPASSGGKEGENARRRRPASGSAEGEGTERRRLASGSTEGESARRRRPASGSAEREGTRRRQPASGSAEREGTRRRQPASGSAEGEGARRRRPASGSAEGNSQRRRSNTSYNNEGKRESASYESGEERPRRRSTASENAVRPTRRRPSSSVNGEERESRDAERSPRRERYSDTETVRERRTRTVSKNTPDLTRLAVNPKVIGAAAAVLLIVIGVIVGVRSFGASHRTAENVVKELVKASVDGNAGGMKDAYGINGEVMVDMQEAFDATAAYYKAHNVKKTEIKTSGTLFEDGNYSYVYILYNLLLDNDQEYPCIATYITQNMDGKYYVLTPANVTEDLSAKATASYQKFMTTDTYKNYSREYDTFIKKNPGYEEKIAAKLA